MVPTTGGSAHGADDTDARIVVGVDGSASARRALEWAADQAARTGMRLVVHTAYEPVYAFLAARDVDQGLERVISGAIAHVHERQPGGFVEGKTDNGPPAKALVTASRRADLLVVGSRGLGGFGGLLLGSVGRSCSLHAHCPVVIVR